jgi:hypothetical protein
MAYELWDSESGNLVGRYATEDEALVAVRETVALYGPDAAGSLLLGVEDPDRRSKAIARGPALVELACATALAATSDPFLAKRGSEDLSREESAVARSNKIARSTHAHRDSTDRLIRQDPAKQVRAPDRKASKTAADEAPKSSLRRSSRKGG